MGKQQPTRRQLITGLGTIAAIAPLAVTQQGKANAATTMPVLKPSRLQPGDGVGIVSPAGATFDSTDLDIVVDAVRGLGLIPQIAPRALDRYGYLAGQDRDRAADINRFFANPNIAALLPIRGDWGSARTLPYLDYEIIRQNPKVIVGFSDITALLLGITAQTGLVTFHGPNGLTSWKPDQTESFRRVLLEGQTFAFENPIAAEDSDRLMQTRFRVNTITSGQARGRLYGGNLSVIAGIAGSPYLPDLTGAILFLEDVGESVYRIDRMLTQLKLSGVLDQLAGFVFGQCTRCGPSGGYGALTLEEVLQDHIAPLGIPAWSNAAIGHVEPILTIPMGLDVEINADDGKMIMTERAIA
ncbi:LD-carboxypeptidase [Oscillatoria sp. CS-180]|uniref:S66 peptidase family protein n=1 Tax=Oscillatoria sp. CS-180 TaxID=3021720 RepID=UPI00232DC28C|nr:LD-carboxypeptidase [Oscillatoria sp. CS-180]MDB9525713.1 LD-carboxypeptidase [Oscillatoria sp. CS-180]